MSRPRKHAIDTEELRRLYWDEGLSIRRVSQRLGVRHWITEYALLSAGIPLRKVVKKVPSVAIVKRLYWFDEMPISRIAERYDMSHQAVYEYMRLHGIPRRKVGWNGRQKTSVCKERNCGKHVCKQKFWKKKRAFWRWSCRCMDHLQEFMREHSRVQAEKRRRKLGMRKLRPRGAFKVYRKRLSICAE